MAFCKRCYMEFKAAWHKQNRGKAFNINMKDVIFKCQLVTFDHNGYGDPVVRLFDCKTKSYEFISPKEYQKRKKEGRAP